MELKKLKSGSDIRGTAIEAFSEEVNLTQDVVKQIGDAFVVWLSRKYASRDINIGVGHDSRLTSEGFKDTLLATFKNAGIKSCDASLASTPSMFAMTKNPNIDCDGAIMITASHHPYHKNGLKFFTKEGGLSGAQIDEIIALAEEGVRYEGKKSSQSKKDYVGMYSDGLVDMVRDRTGEKFPLQGLKIVVDAGNGAGGFFAEKVLKPLGADTAGSQFLNPDGNFPNHVPNPEDSTAMASISRCVVNNNADLGIIFDTDVDRAAVVDKSGTEINRNRLIALASSIVLDTHPDAYIVTDSVTSTGLKKFINNAGGNHFRFKRGYNNVIAQGKKLITEGKNVQLAIETSGHAAFRENDFLDDGAYLVTKILIKMAQLRKEEKEISSLIESLEEPKSRYEVRITYKDKSNYKQYGEVVIENLTEFSKNALELETSTYEGVRTNVSMAKGWFLLRQSVHDPNMVLNIESDDPEGAKSIAKLVYRYLANYEKFNCDSLKTFATN